MTALDCAFKGANDELEEDEDLHNKLKYDHKISDEQITANNAKISPESARVAQLTDESDMLEEDIAASKSKLSDATTTREKQLTEYRETNKAKKKKKQRTSRVLQKHQPNSALQQL